MPDNSTGELKLACIGAGYFSQFHIAAWQRLDAVGDITLVDSNRARIADSGLRNFDAVDDMLQRYRPDVIDIITPPATHFDIIEACVGSGVEAIICQKPFCEDLKSALEAIALAQRHGVKLVVHENFRFQPWYRRMKQALDDGLVGEHLQLSFRLRPGDGQGAGAYLERQPYFQTMPRFLVHETAIHFIDTFRYLLGEPESIFADLRRHNPAISGEDSGYLLFAFERGVRALFDGNRLLDHAADNTRCTMGEALLEGTEGTIYLDGDGRLSLRKFGQREMTVLLEPQTWQGFGGDCVFNLQQHVVTALLDGGEIENLAADYVVNMQWEELAYESSGQGRVLARSHL